MFATCWPPPKLRTLLLESERSLTESVPTCDGRSFSGGGLEVYLGSKRSARAVTSWFTITQGEGGVVFLSEGLGLGRVDDAVLMAGPAMMEG
jgi:hypothetical protein